MAQEIIQINKATPVGKRRVCAYTRVSSKSEDQENSLAYQIEAYTKMIMTNPTYEFCGVFVDDGVTGTSIYKRKEFQKMIDKALSGQIDLIITKSLSRFSRNTEDAINILRVLRNNNVEVYFETENISSFNMDSELVINVLSAHAANESKVISDNVRMSYAKNFKDKKAYFNPEQLYGYHRGKDGSIVIDEKEAEAVRLIYDLYLKDYTRQAIIDELDRRGLKPRFTKKWTFQAFRKILHNEKYMGAAYLQKTFVKGVRGKRLKNDGTLPTILIENNHPAIVTKEVWLAANEKLKQKAIQYQSQVQYDEKREGKICFNKSIYSGLFMCGKCGKNYNFKINNRGKASESRIFHCASNRERKTCENDDLPLDVIDIITLKVVNKIITNKKNFFDLLEESFNSKNDVEKKKKEIQELQEKIDVLQAKFKKYKDIDDEFYREVNKAYKEKLKPLYMKKVALENSISTATSVNDYLYQFKKVLSPYDRTVSSLIDFPLNKVFSRVIIHDRDHITFVLGEAGDISTIASMDDDILIQTEPYLIRKTKHLLKYGIYIN